MDCNLSECGARCCGPVPMDTGLIQKYKNLINKNAHIKNLGDIALCYDKSNLACGFLNDEKKCKIYVDRPDICKMFGDKHHNILILKCQFLGQIGTMEQEKIMDNTVSRLNQAVKNGN